MNRNIFLILILFLISVRTSLYGINAGEGIGTYSNLAKQDTIKERQLLYNGIIWKNRYHRIEGDQFLFSGFFLPGTISVNGKTFKDLRLKYDIYSDEIITPLNRENILQLNKEMVDSFTLTFEDKVYRFTNIRNDTLKGFVGYINILYKGRSGFYVKYIKSISPESTPKGDGYFIQNQVMYLMKDNLFYPINGSRSLFKILNKNTEQIRSLIRKNKLKLSKKIPESYVPVIRFYDSISQ
jgi:hypothetical protein